MRLYARARFLSIEEEVCKDVGKKRSRRKQREVQLKNDTFYGMSLGRKKSACRATYETGGGRKKMVQRVSKADSAFFLALHRLPALSVASALLATWERISMICGLAPSLP
jgi:hypothetical protein